MSTILSKEDLNDFITPGVACIKPVKVEKTSDHAEIEIGTNGEAYEVSIDGSQKTKLDAAQISLSDCLACSGCITSAESVLVSMQSHTEVLSALAKGGKVFVASISHQARVSLAGAYGLSVEESDKRLQGLLSRLGFSHVVGMEIGRAVALEYGALEVASRKGKGPVLSSSCPGWTCYVEKTHPHMIPYLSNVKSPQQITGSLIKHLLSRQHGVTNDKIYHLSIMPCFDKKLEASRPEFGSEESRDVDCVITTKEIVQLLIDRGEDFASLPAIRDELPAVDQWPVEHQWHSHQGTSSGGYLDYVLASIRSQHPGATLEVAPGRNSDIVDYILKQDNKVVGKAAQIYGFRNIQNLVRKLKRKNHNVDYDYVEVMACPGGCINGGGQIGRPAETTAKEWKDKMEELYSSMKQYDIVKGDVQRYVRLWGGSEDELTGAHFKAVDKENSNIPKALSVGTTW